MIFVCVFSFLFNHKEIITQYEVLHSVSANLSPDSNKLVRFAPRDRVYERVKESSACAKGRPEPCMK